MTFLRGDVVRSVAGHDRGDLFLVLREEGDFLWLVDGKCRKLETPKKKTAKARCFRGGLDAPGCRPLARRRAGAGQ